MSKLVIISISTGNAAFEDAGETQEVARILRDLADRLERTGPIYNTDSIPLRDANGNRVGVCNVLPENNER